MMGRSYQEIIAECEFAKTNCARCGAPLENGECGHCSPTRSQLRERERRLAEERAYNRAMTEVPVVQNQPPRPDPSAMTAHTLGDDSVDMGLAMRDILGVGLQIFAVIVVVAGLCVGFNKLFNF